MNLREFLDSTGKLMSTTADPGEMLERLGQFYGENIGTVAADTPKEMLEEFEAMSKTEEQKHEEKIRNAVRQCGGVYWKDVNDCIAGELPGIPHTALAAACAERLLHRHLQGPVQSQRPFTVSCRHPLDCVWGVLAAQPDPSDLRVEVELWLQGYYDSPLNHNLGQDGPNDADDDPAAATIFAVESLVKNCVKSSTAAMGRVIDAGMDDAERELNHRITGHNEYIAELAHPAVQRELRWLKDVVEFLKSNSPTSTATIMELRVLSTR